MSADINTYTQPVYQFAPQPTRQGRNRKRNE